MFSELSALRAWSLLPTMLPPTKLAAEPEIQDFMAWTNELSAEACHEVLTELANLLPAVEVAPASVLVLCCGTLVEKSGQSELAFPALLTHFQRLQELSDAGETPPEEAFRFTVMGLMTMLCRSLANRRQLQRQPGLTEWLDEHEAVSDHLYYLAGVLQLSDEESLYVLYPEYGTGLEVSISQVNNGFHLLTLLQPLVLRQAAALGLRKTYEPIDDELIRFASGDPTATPDDEVDTALFGWLNALAYQGGPLDPLQLVWGEMPIRGLPRVQNRVVVMATESKGMIQRSWSISFCAVLHDAHRPLLQLRRLLTPAEVAAVLHEIHPPVEAKTGSQQVNLEGLEAAVLREIHPPVVPPAAPSS